MEFVCQYYAHDHNVNDLNKSVVVLLQIADTLLCIAVYLRHVTKSVVRYTDCETVMPVFPYIAHTYMYFLLDRDRKYFS